MRRGDRIMPTLLVGHGFKRDENARARERHEQTGNFRREAGLVDGALSRLVAFRGTVTDPDALPMSLHSVYT